MNDATQSDIYYQAMLARDYRFDGKFFVGVKTTGIYCRPICPARPKRENIVFFSQDLEAERAGFRPCLRCRPESAPAHPAWSGESGLIQRALQLIASEQGPWLQESDYAQHLGITARHLRRLFHTEFGQTPTQIMHRTRLNFARKLVVETSLPLLTVALTAGFGSLRRFNDAFKQRFHRPPSELRKHQSAVIAGEDCIEMTLPFRPPYHWAGLIDFFQRHQIGGVEHIRPDAYERLFKASEQPGSVPGYLHVSLDPNKSQLRLRIKSPDPQILFTVVHRLRRQFDLDSDPLLIANCFASQAALDNLWHHLPGLRLPGAWDGFETAVCIILGQLVSLQRARDLVAELVARYGEPVLHPLTGEPARLFPTAQALAGPDTLELKTTSQRKRTLQLLARQVFRGELSLSPAQDPARFRAQLLQLPGIGPWTVENIALRVLGDPDAFPNTDLILKQALERHPDLDLTEIKPWRAYAAVALWQEHLEHRKTG